ncbi:hypothetical protein MTR_2g076150 [Medicago truncatula]|uniref:Cysteine protease n=1 Tax=Medicago truncatula TaxID=3880 RepID=G7ITH5_MEDTR|nr:hypothetical protein MTR_2g076150 [Medicago truncatula]
MTNMIMFLSLEYLCLRICNVDDAKVIVIDRICTCSKLTFNLNQINTALRQEIKNTPHKDGKSKQTKSFKDDEIRKTNERKQKICEITYSTRIKEKTIRKGDFWIKIDSKSSL